LGKIGADLVGSDTPLSARLKILKAKQAEGKNRVPIQRVYKDLSLPGWQQKGEYTWERTTDIPLASGSVKPYVDNIPLLYYDSETTGLSGGAGNIIFLFGLGFLFQLQGPGTPDFVFRVRQFFLADYPGEPDFLTAIRSSLDENAGFVSYNGKSFDWPLLKTRFLMNKIDFVIRSQRDLLYITRRFWRSLLENCSLSTIEQQVLGIQREGDIPGFLVPEYYFRFLKTGDTSKLDGIFSHNLQDIYSLYLLSLRIDEILKDPYAAGVIDRIQLGKTLFSMDPARGLKYLESISKSSDLSESSKAKRILGLIFKRQRAWKPAVRYWEELLFTINDVEGGIELAKFLEHRAKNLSRALEVTDLIMKNSISEKIREGLAHRRNRLRKKLGL
jgi:uncharacterized protein